ncbi:myc proto-oncogene protein-like [Argonauta hians]
MSGTTADIVDSSIWPLFHNDPTLEDFEFMSHSLEFNSDNEEWLTSSDPFNDLNFDNLDELFGDPDILQASHRLDCNNNNNNNNHPRTALSSTTNSSPSHSPTSYESDYLTTDQQTPSPSSSREFFSSQTSSPSSPWSPVGSPLSTQPDSPLGGLNTETSFDFRNLLAKSGILHVERVTVEQIPVELTATNLAPTKGKGKRGRPSKKNLDRRILKAKRTGFNSTFKPVDSTTCIVKYTDTAVLSPERLEHSVVRLSPTNSTDNIETATTTVVPVERKKRKCMTDEEKKVHNELERRRRAAMSQRLAHLKKSVDKIRDDPKASTKKIVDEAIIAIEDCKIYEQELLIELQSLTDYRQRLKDRIHLMKEGMSDMALTSIEMDAALSEDEYVSVV